MRRTLVAPGTLAHRRLAATRRAACLLALVAGPAAAQPARPPGPPQASFAPSAEERSLLEQGEITGLEHIGGGIAGAVIGFGIGQALQGRWTQRGWLFTLGEGASMAALVWGGTRIATHCPAGEASGCGDRGVGLAMGGAMALAAFRAWGTLDAFIVPPGHNRQVSQLRRRAARRAGAPLRPLLRPYVTTARAGDGLVGGLSLRF